MKSQREQSARSRIAQLEKELEIEAALEQVRVRAMAMHDAGDIDEVVIMLFDELLKLGVEKTIRCGINIFDDAMHSETWTASYDTTGKAILTKGHIDLGIHPMLAAIYKAWQNKEPNPSYELAGPELKKYYRALIASPGYHFQHKIAELPKKQVCSTFSYPEGCLFAFTAEPLSADASRLFTRFTAVFGLTYRRFLDLQKAEAQAREARIEAALEHVRSRTMGMQKSGELAEVIQLIFDQFVHLGFNINSANFNTDYRAGDDAKLWLASSNQSYPAMVFVPYFDHPVFNIPGAATDNGSDHFVTNLTFSEKNQWWDHFFKNASPLPHLPRPVLDRVYNAPGFYSYGVMMKTVLLTITNYESYAYTEAEQAVVMRFGKVFEQTYTRFNDLKQAEAQAREGQIQLAMERVRARTMAMQKSNELAETVSLLFKQLLGLGIHTEQIRTCGIVTFKDNVPVGEQWITETNGEIIPQSFMVPYDKAPAYKAIYKAWKHGEQFMVIHLEGKKLKEHLGYLAKGTNVPTRDVVLPQQAKEIFNHVMFFSQGCLFIITKEALPEYHDVFKRFGAVFQQSYTRFLDLQKAEEQVREAQIEAALERVRSRSMGMQKSEELREVIQVIYEQLKQLNFNIDSANFALDYKDSDDFNLWLSSAGQLYPTKVHTPYVDLPIFNRFIEAKANGFDFLTENYSFEEKNAFFDHFFKNVQGVTDERKAFVMNTAGYARSTVLMKNVTLSMQNYAAIPYSEEENAALRRFGKVFEQTYTRFLDLQQAEAQAREAKIEAGLERVRAKAMSMQTSEELNALLGTVFDELTKLDLVLTRCVIVIYEPETNSCRWWMANSEAPAAPMNFFVKYHELPPYKAYLKGWKEGTSKWRYELKGKIKKDWDDFIFTETELSLLPDFVIAGMKAPDHVLLSASFYNFGCLTLASLEPLPDEGFDIMLRFGKVFDMSYTRFNDLKQAEAQAREAKIQLALERVRARTMAMQQSGELAETAMTLFQQFNGLGITPERIFIGIVNDDTQRIDFWGTEQGGNQMNPMFEVNVGATVGFSQIYKAWKAKKKTHTVVMKGEELADHVHYVQDVLNMPIQQELVQGQRIMYSAFFSKGLLMIVTPEIQSNETLGILERFAGVFDGTYTRFLDLQQAEAQAREAKIELGLERVRARAMAMQNSDELAGLVATIFNELTKLDFSLTRCAIYIMGENLSSFRAWRANTEIDQAPESFYIKFTGHPFFNAFFKAWKERKLKWVYDLKGIEKQSLDDYFFNETEYSRLPDIVKAGMRKPERVFLSYAFNNFGGLQTAGLEPLSDANLDILSRFGKVFDMTYTRFNDLKQAETQAREAKIEASLERVRAAAMAMHDSNDVGNATALVFSELYKLGITTIRCGVVIIEESTKLMEVWSATSPKEGKIDQGSGKLDMTSHPLWQSLFDTWKQKKPVLTYELMGQDLLDYYKAISSAPGYKAPELDPSYAISDDISKARQYCSCFLFAEGGLFAFTGEPFPPAESKVLEKFAAVFSLTYRRYLDLKQAEEQAREAKIEAALERVRSRTMGMQQSEELKEVIQLIFEQFLLLNFNVHTAMISVDFRKTNDLNVWSATPGQSYPTNLYVPYTDDLFFNDAKQAKENGLDFYTACYTFEEKNEFFNYFFEHVDSATLERKELVLNSAGYAMSNVLMKDVALIIANFSAIPYSEAENATLLRFGKVFEQTYTRFNDLKQAEEQAHEAKIEVALERVRARAMSMHQSQDINAAVLVVFEELEKLDLEILRCGIGIIDKANQVGDVWTTVKLDGRSSIQLSGKEPMNIHPLLRGTYDAWLDQTDFLYNLEGDDLMEYYRAVAGTNFTLPESHSLTDENDGAKQYYYTPTFKTGNLYAFRESPFPEGAKSIMKRFASVLNLTFSRFLDLQKAEAQAREAQIEASLERVRSKAMSMRNSGDLLAAASTVFIELQNLGINQIRSGVGLIAKDFHKAKVYSATSSQNVVDLSLMGEVTLYGHPVFEQQYQSWLKRENYFVALEGKELASYYKILSAGLNADLGLIVKKNQKEYGHWFMFSEGFLYAWSDKEYTDAEIKILERFKNVMELTITRYIELQKSEAQARDAVRQASLDRVRAEIASMRTIGDLDRITPLIWNELTILGVPFIRCGVFIMDEPAQVIHTYLSTPEGKAIAAFQLHFNDDTGNGVNQTALAGWRNKQVVTLHWTEEEFRAFSHNLVEQGEIASEEGYLTERPPTGLDLHFFPFLQGMLYAGNTDPLSDEDKDLVQSLADAFSTAYARYEDFNRLELAKKEVERTLTDLKAAQTRLIQSEKMASLGELTAGIAHEIQNPLNFVNNFSEVNQEMIDELEEELNAGNIEEALAIAADIKQNEQKINHHGKRADGIVKGMLQHSRTAGGEKLPTNINSVAGEYMRLSYHGLRAKDKAFNAEMVMNFDPDLPKIQAVGQDIGRVFLNLFNNAFYAVNQKKKAVGGEYKPEVSVSTSTKDGQVIIKVKDNGVGMPEQVKEKIMQPFFTTKPTGEGTGLGLSLTYDMVVKGHGGKIEVNTKESEFTEFIVTLPLNEN